MRTIDAVRPVREQVPSVASWHHHVRAEASFPFSWHHHTEHELVLVRRGQGRRFVGDDVGAYAPGDLVLVGPDLPHSWQSDDLPPGPHEALVVQLRPDFLGPELIRRPEFAAVGHLLDDAGPGLSFPGATAADVDALTRDLDRQDPARATITLLQVLLTLAESATTPLSSSATPILRPDQQERLERVQRLVAERYAEPIPLARAAREAGMAPAAFSRLFSRGTGRSFTEHVTDVRLAAARQHLRHTDAPVAAIAHRCGFANLAHFNRRFRAAVGATPSAYRRSAATPGRSRAVIKAEGRPAKIDWRPSGLDR